MGVLEHFRAVLIPLIRKPAPGKNRKNFRASLFI